MNSNYIDRSINPKFYYNVKKNSNNIGVLRTFGLLPSGYIYKDSLRISLTVKEAKKLSNIKKIAFTNNYGISKEFNPSWSYDNFGPLVVPSNSCFVLSDNRHNSIDSRFIGFINLKDIKATVIR